MNQREKVLAACVGLVIVGYGGYTGIMAGIIKPGQRLQDDIRKATGRRDTLDQRLSQAPKIKRDWQAVTQRTLDADYKVAHDIFRRDIAVLLDRNKLTENRSISKYKERLEKKGPREGFIEDPVAVRVNGKLSDLVNFLRDLYQRPYLVNVEKLSISAELEGKHKRKGKARKRGGGSKEPTLKITMTLSTLVLPKVAGVEHKTFDMAALNDPERQEQVLAAASWLGQEDLSTYEEIVKIDPFRIWEPPAAKPKETPKPVVKNDHKPVQPRPKVDPRRDADKWVLVGTANDGAPIAYVTNSDELTEPPKEYRLNDEVDGGRLVLVTAEGIVVRVKERVGRRETAKNYFYPLGGTFRDREQLSSRSHPEVHRLLQLVLKR